MPETMKLLDKYGKMLQNFGRGKYFFGQEPKSKETKAKPDEWGYMKLKSFYFHDGNKNSTT
jgi:hypothetical protein